MRLYLRSPDTQLPPPATRLLDDLADARDGVAGTDAERQDVQWALGVGPSLLGGDAAVGPACPFQGLEGYIIWIMSLPLQGVAYFSRPGGRSEGRPDRAAARCHETYPRQQLRPACRG